MLKSCLLNSSLGSPSSLPSVPSDYSTFNHLSAEMKNLYRIDTDNHLSAEMKNLYRIDTEILTYESSNFEMEDGKILTGDQLTTHLRMYNKMLADKAKLYTSRSLKIFCVKIIKRR